MNQTTSYRDLFSGLDCQVPLLDGTSRAYINLDNAASTPAMSVVEQTVHQFLQYYSSVHRGTGFKSQLSTHAYEESRRRVTAFLGGNQREHVCIFGKNTTEMVNHLARRAPITPDKPLVLVSTMEHHSNDLPWRAVAQVLHIGVRPDGQLDEDDYDRLLKEYAGRIALVSITGASNVTGFINPIHRLAEKAHAAGAQIAVDCAQLAPHRKVQMGALDEPDHLDYVIISAHKMYAPFGTGALVGRRDTFECGEPDHRGGGQVEFVSLDTVAWSGAPERDEAGSPNTVGAVALAAAVKQLDTVGMEAVAHHEAYLTAYALEKLAGVAGLHLYGSTNPARASERLGVLPLRLEGISHFLVSSILGHEFGIGVRSGCFCAHPYLMKLMGYSEESAAVVRETILAGDRREMPGMVRASFGLYNTFDDVDALVEALTRISRGQYRGVYRQEVASGEYLPEGWSVNFADYFAF